MRNFWNIIRSLTPEKPHSNAPDLIENENGENITEANEITESFNKCFCSQGKKLVAKIDCSKPNDFRDYLTNSVHSSMYLHPTSPFEILCIILLSTFVSILVSSTPANRSSPARLRRTNKRRNQSVT